MAFFKSLNLSKWRQFDRVELDFGRQFTVLTGKNGCGKTTILNILNRHFGWNISFVSTPFISKKTAKKIWTDIYGKDFLRSENEVGQQIQVGTIRYDNSTECKLYAKQIESANYQLQYSGEQIVLGLHIPSHRPGAVYHNVSQVPTNPQTAQQHYQEYQNMLFQSYVASRAENPGLIQKRSIISLALFGYGNQAVLENREFIEIFEGFQQVLKNILPPELGFKKIEVRMPEVVLVTESGDFALDAMSGGINALFGIAWQIYMFGHNKDTLIVTIDEPENHLHPSMQRSLLPSLSKAFPKYRFIVATHSPFIVTSSPDSAVYGLFFNSRNRIESHLLEGAELSGTPNTVLREVLDINSNFPIWVEEKIIEIFSKYKDLKPEKQAGKIMEELKNIGVTSGFSEINLGKKNAKN